MKISSRGRYAIDFMVDLAPISCIEEGENGCAHWSTCSTIKIWQKLNSAINEVVDNISLADIVEWNREE